MNEPSPSAEPAIFGGTCALRIGLGLVAGLALMLALAAFDKSRRPTLERMEEVTAVGDRLFLRLPAEPGASPPVVLSWLGQSLEVDAASRHEFRDTLMRRVGRDKATRTAIYEYNGPARKDLPATAAPEGRLFYLKVAPGEYVTARARSGK